MIALVTQKEGTNQHGEPADSLIHGCVDYTRALGFTPLPIPNDIASAREITQTIDYRFLFVTGGGFAPIDYFSNECVGYVPQARRDEVELFLIHDAVAKGIPILGLCRGMHMLNGVFGGTLVRNGSNSAPRHDHYVTFPSGKQVLVNTFHNNAIPIDQLSSEFDALAVETGTNNVECFISEKKRILGLQWHPERTLPSEEAIAVSAQLTSWLLHGTPLPQGCVKGTGDLSR